MGDSSMSFLLKDQAYDKLIQLINEGKLQYGETYSLNALSKNLEMSRTPVRDAIQKLADEKRIDVLPSRGIRLHQMSTEELTQHYHFSTAIEGYCAASLAENREADSQQGCLHRMREIVAGMWELAGSDQEFEKFFSLDQQFHRELLESLGDPYFSSLQNSPMGFFNHPELQQMTGRISRKDICQCHQVILDAVLEGDSSKAYKGVMNHAALMYRTLL